MGYKIMYSPEDNSKYPMRKPTKSRSRWIIPLLLVAVLILALGRPHLRTKLEDWLVPGDTDVTKAAFAAMVGQLREGENAVDAVTAFCRMIIDGSEDKLIYET